MRYSGILGIICLSAAAAAATGLEYEVVDRIPGADGGSDYVSIDSANRRLYVGREHGVMMIDLAAREVTRQLIDTGETAAVLVIPDTRMMLATAPEDDKAVLFDRFSGKHIADFATGDGPDAAAWDSFSRFALVMNAEGKTITLIDPKKRKVVGQISVPGVPEAAVSNGRGLVYVNLEDTAEVAVIDIVARRVTSRYPLSGCAEPTGIALDKESGTLISACHNQVTKLISISGEDRGTVASGAEADGAVFDAKRRVALIPAMDSTLTVFSVDRSGKPGPAQTIETLPRARTIALDQATGRVYLPNRRKEPNDKGEMVSVPGSFNVLILQPKRQSR